MVFYAQWLDSSTPEYTVTFNANGATVGAPPAPQTVYRGISITVPAQGTLAYSGKTFGGWNTQPNGGGTNYETDAPFTVTVNVTLYAKWQSAIQYTVTYNSNGADGAAPTAQKVDPGTEITIQGAGSMTYTGKAFTGWSVNAGGAGTIYAADDHYTVTGNVTFYAQWQSQCTVTYDANGASGTVSDTQTVVPGTEIILQGADNLVYTEKKFIGWRVNTGGSGTLYAAGDTYTVTGDVTFYAQWQGPCTVTYHANGASGAAPDAQTVDPGTEITLQGAGSMIYTGKQFIGWNTNANGTGASYAVGDLYTVIENITFFAQWQSPYTVAYNANGADGTVPDSQTAYPGTEITLQGTGSMTYTGKKFIGWNTNASGTGTSYAVGDLYTVTGNITFFAQWLDLYTVIFNANGASGAPPNAQTVDPGTAITLPGAETMIYSGRVFEGWNTQANGGGTSYAAETTYTVTGDVTLYAKWRSEIQYSVIFNANGASGTVPDAQTVDPGTVITLPGAGTMTWSGKMFDVWNTQADGSGTNFAEGAPYTVNADISLYAQWIIMPVEVPGITLADKLSWLSSNAESATTYLITLNYDEGIGPTSLSYTGKNNITLRIRNTAMRTITLSSKGILFSVGSGVTLILDSNITLQGRSDNDRSLVYVNSGGALIMNTGTKITGNTNNNYNYYGGGVYVGGTFTMNGGEISGNTYSYNDRGGGGVYVYGGTFTMNDGEISGNNSYNGGGVYVYGGTFTMNGGEIPSNTSRYYGGGVYVLSANYITSTLTKNGGTIYGSNGGNKSNTVKNTSGTLLDDRGHAVYASSSPAKRMENTVGPGVYLYFKGGTSPVWSGGWEY
jgi:uncharacterized repeat protein (TIGR02543 family)